MTVRVTIEMEVVQMGVDRQGQPRKWLTTTPLAQVRKWLNCSRTRHRLFTETGACLATPPNFIKDHPMDADHTWIRLPSKDDLLLSPQAIRGLIDDKFGACHVEVYQHCMMTSQPLNAELYKSEQLDQE